MSNFSIRIDLLKLQGAFVKDLQGKTCTKRCVIIPVDENESVYLGEKGCYLNVTAIEMREARYGETHCIKGDIPRDKREAMTAEQRKEQPILGGMKPLQQRQKIQINNSASSEVLSADSSDVPF